MEEKKSLKDEYERFVLETLEMAGENRDPQVRAEYAKWVPRMVMTYHEMYGGDK